MKALKIVFKLIIALVVLILFTIGAILLIDKSQTAYLNQKNFEHSELDSYLIKNVKLIPMTRDTILENQMVLVENGIIKSVNSSVEAKAFQVIDGENGYLMPGLTDMHVHVWDKQELGLYLANGVTCIRNVWGMPMHLRMKKEAEDDNIYSPIFFTTGPKLTGPEFIGDDNLNLLSAEEGAQKVKAYKERGYDFIKSYYGLPENIFDAIIEEARKQDMDIVAHPSQKVPYTYHLNPQIVSIEHVEDIFQRALNYQLDTLGLDSLMLDFAASPHTSFCPTVMAFYNIYRMIMDEDILSSEEVKMMNPSIQINDSKIQFDRWQGTKVHEPTVDVRIKKQHEFHLLAISKLHAAGVNIVCGTDAGIGVTLPGFSIHEELAFYKEAGLTNYEVLKTATANIARSHSVMKDLGTVESGKVANLILLKQNPLDNLQALKDIEWVMLKGKKLDAEHLENLKAKAKDRKNFLATALRYIEYMIIEK